MLDGDPHRQIKRWLSRGWHVHIRPFAEKKGKKKRLIWIVQVEREGPDNQWYVAIEENPNLGNAIRKLDLKLPGRT